MLQPWVIALVALGYIGVLFAIAYYGDRRVTAGRSLINNPYVYALSLAVYCTAWTFYGSVGRAATTGVGFLPIYVGPTLMAALWWFVLRKIIRISKVNRITSIADFIASRYGKSTLLGSMVTLVAVVGIIPYIALQLKAVSISFTLLWHFPDLSLPPINTIPVLRDTGFYVALMMAAFAILFGTRHLDATEHHEGLVVAIAFESVIKLVAFLAVGVFVTYGVYNGFGDIFTQAAARPELRRLFTFGDSAHAFENWFWLTVLSMMAIMFLPRQFQMAVVENVNERHLNTAIWLFPLYLILINIFVLPIALAGRLTVSGPDVNADMFVLLMPMIKGNELLALFTFIGGLSAATGMIIVETVALSTMVSNDLLMPLLLRTKVLRPSEHQDLPSLLLLIRRAAILFIVLLGYLYFRLTGEALSLVSIGLISFAAVAQFAPAIIGGIYWKGGTRLGAVVGLVSGFLVWAYTLPVPSLVQAGWLEGNFVEQGPFGITWLRPYTLFGLSGLDPVTHSLFWSMVANIGGYLVASLIGPQSVIEHRQASLFVDVFKQVRRGEHIRLWRGTTSVPDIQNLLERFVGRRRARAALAEYARERGVTSVEELEADSELVDFAERLLAGTIGAASARVAIATVVTEEPLSIEQVIHMLDEASQVIAYSRQLEQKSHELEAVTAELRAANERLKELDRLKDEFISTVTHELRTPLTSIRAMAEILYDHPELDTNRRAQFLGIILKESERLSRLINQVLDFAKLESGMFEWHVSEVNLRSVVEEAVASTEHLFRERNVRLRVVVPAHVPTVEADHDRLVQVMFNLLSNAAKFAQDWVEVRLTLQGDVVRVDVSDNGPGISPEEQELIFEKFRQLSRGTRNRPQGTGLGLPISRHIVEHLGGRLWVESTPGAGATFSFILPVMVSEGAIAPVGVQSS
ncbi:MAG: sensor histidine kinase [Ardenticatenia bacterium]|nr:sensor histidine kinase [Ardenticatenia bacterium]